MNANGFFKQPDPHIEELAGYQLPLDWWSRGYEYSWALEYASPSMTVADMGCGWMYRPFKDALDDLGCAVCAVDGDKRLLTQEKRPDIEYVVADFTNRIEEISTGRLDRVFCISVFEDLGDMAAPALKEFARVIKPDGLIVLTFDVPYLDAPTPVYPGLPLDKFEQSMKDAGLRYSGSVDYDKEDAVNHQEWNLCVFHCSLTKDRAVDTAGSKFKQEIDEQIE